MWGCILHSAIFVNYNLLLVDNGFFDIGWSFYCADMFKLSTSYFPLVLTYAPKIIENPVQLNSIYVLEILGKITTSSEEMKLEPEGFFQHFPH